MKQAVREGLWRARISKWRRSGLSGPKFCARHGLNLKSFYTWRKRLVGERGPQSSSSDLVPVQLVAVSGDVRIEIGVAAIMVTEQSSPVALRTALLALGMGH